MEFLNAWRVVTLSLRGTALAEIAKSHELFEAGDITCCVTVFLHQKFGVEVDLCCSILAYIIGQRVVSKYTSDKANVF